MTDIENEKDIDLNYQARHLAILSLYDYLRDHIIMRYKDLILCKSHLLDITEKIVDGEIQATLNGLQTKWTEWEDQFFNSVNLEKYRYCR